MSTFWRPPHHTLFLIIACFPVFALRFLPHLFRAPALLYPHSLSPLTLSAFRFQHRARQRAPRGIWQHSVAHVNNK